MYSNEDYERRSLNNALALGNNIRAFEKVNENIKMIDDGISQLISNSLKISLNNNSSNITEKTNKLIKSTSQYIIEAFNFIKDIKDFDYSSNIQRNENIKRANDLERIILKKKNKLEEIVETIKNQGEKYINNARNSLRIIEEQERESSFGNNNISNSQEMKLISERSNIAEEIQEKQNLINFCAQTMEQINEITKFQNEKIVEAGQKIDNIEDNIEQMTSNINNAVEHMNQAKKYNEDAGGYSNYCLYIIGGIVILLVLLVLIMPSS